MTHTIKIIAPLLLADTVCRTSHSLLLLVQLSKLVTTAHEQTAIERAACWKLNICQFERGMKAILKYGSTSCCCCCCTIVKLSRNIVDYCCWRLICHRQLGTKTVESAKDINLTPATRNRNCFVANISQIDFRTPVLYGRIFHLTSSKVNGTRLENASCWSIRLRIHLTLSKNT